MTSKKLPVAFSVATKSDGPLTKEYSISNGKLIKNSKNCFLAMGRLDTFNIDFSELPALLDKFTTSQALIHGITLRESCQLVSKRHQEKYPDAITRTLENFFYPEEGLLIFDYDPVGSNNPLSKDELILSIRSLHPELAKAALVWRPSASSLLFGDDGTEYAGLKNQRIYMPYKNPSHLHDFVSNLERASWEKGQGSIFISKTGTPFPRCLFDTAVFSPERLDFAVGAMCLKGLMPQVIVSTYEPGDYVDLENIGELYPKDRFENQVQLAKADMKFDIEKARKEYKERETLKLQTEYKVGKNQAKRAVTARLANKLLPEDVVYTDDMEPIRILDIIESPERYHGTVVRDPLEPEYGPSKAKIFTDGETIMINSFAHGGRKFTVNLNLEYYLAHLAQFDDNEELLEAWLEKINVFDGTNADKELLLKSVSKRTGVAKTALAKDLKEKEKAVQEDDTELPLDLTHNEIAQRVLATMPKHTVATEGRFYSYNGQNCWQPTEVLDVELEVSNRFDGLARCCRYQDYGSVAKQAYKLAFEEHFFFDTPPGVATKDFCYVFNGKSIIQKDHDPSLKIRFKFDYNMADSWEDAILLRNYLAWAFFEDEEQQLLAQEIAGATLFGVINRDWHKAVLLRGSGGNGKSVYLDILKGMIPPQYISNVSPYQFNNPVFTAQLANKLLNIVGELDKNKKLPADSFKTIVDSGDILGKELYKNPVRFASTAAHIFSSNFKLRTDDASEGMRRRWLILGFNNKVKKEDRIAEFGDLIVEKEAPYVLKWAAEGLERLYQNKGFTETKEDQRHKEMMFEQSETVTSFIHDPDFIILHDDREDPKATATKAGLYRLYKEWCAETGQQPNEILKKNDFNCRMEELGFSWRKTRGHYQWFGISPVITKP